MEQFNGNKSRSMPIDLSLRCSFFAKYEGRSIEDVEDDVDDPRSSSLKKVNTCK